MMPQTADLNAIADALTAQGWIVLPAFLSAAEAAAQAADCRALDAAAALTPAATGRESGRREGGLRGDRTRWFEPDALSPPQAAYWQAMDALRRGLNERLLLGLESVEAHYAVYPPGAGYARHRDRFRDDDARVLSSVCYLNPDWQANDGSALRLHLGNRLHDIAPQAGTLVLFLSADIEHEVLPATRERLSIAGWFRRRELGSR